MEKICGVYMIRCIENNKCYIGSSGNVWIRLDIHKRALKRRKHECSELQEDYDKFCADSFVFELIEQCSSLEKRDAEMRAVKCHISNCYNKNTWNNYRIPTRLKPHNSIRDRPVKKKILEQNVKSSTF